MDERGGRRRALHLVVVAVALSSLTGSSGAEPRDRDAIREARTAAGEAHERQDYDAFLVHSRRLVGLVPHSPRARYNLACAQSLTGDPAGAIVSLERLADWEVTFDLTAETDFDAIRDREGFRRVAARMRALEEPVGASPVAFTLPEKDLLAEGIAHDPKTGAFFVTGVHRPKVVRVGAEGRVSDFVAEGQGGLFSAVGIVVDPGRRALWVTTEAAPLSLVGIQNGLRPHRVVRLRLDASRSRIVQGTVLERAHPLFDEPTLGVVVDGALYYVANSQYRHFAADGTPDRERLQEPVILRLPLPWLREP